jgi:superfamily II DNA or RNA helicase
VTHFETLSRRVRLSLAAVGEDGLREAQAGALMALAAHATVSKDPAQLILPTGVGKTTIATLAPYVLGARRALVVVPSKLIRGQINDGFQNLERAKSSGVLPKGAAQPKVAVALHRAKEEDWKGWAKEADVVIGTPSVLSPANRDVAPMPRDLFDLVVFDEAHHLPATTWTAMLDATDARAVLLTATPFRNDGKRLPGDPVYIYPLARAVEQGVFGAVSYEPIGPVVGEELDLTIAKAAAARLRANEHIAAKSRLLVRTDSVSHARKLVDVYEGVEISLGLIVHETPWKRAERMRAQVESGELLGFVCVGALTEGFDFPALKIGAYHVPHKTLGPTLQFIGRLARVGDIGGVLLAPRDAVTEETSALYREDVGWQKLLPELVDSAIDYEREVRRFVDDATVGGSLDLSPLSLTPARNVHIFLTGSAPDPHAHLDEIGDARVVQRFIHDESRTVAFVTRRMFRPPFLRLNNLDVPIHDLHLMTWVEEQGILFLSTTTDSARRHILDALAPAPRKPLSGLQLRRLLEAAQLDRYFSIGTRAAQPQAARTSYLSRAGSKTEDDITPADARQWDLGHGIGRSGTGTFGFSVQKSKIWEPGAADSLFAFRRWCEELAREIADPNLGQAHSKLDLLTISDPLAAFPSDPLVAVLPAELFVAGLELIVDGELILPELVELWPKPDASTETQIVMDAWIRDEPRGEIRFSVNGSVEMIPGPGWLIRDPLAPQQDLPLSEILVHEPATIFFGDGSRATGDRISPPPPVVSLVSSDIRRPTTWDATDITVEFGEPQDGLLSVGQTVANLLAAEMSIVVQDHLPGELADFIGIDNTHPAIDVRLVHCKKSGGVEPATRVGDVEELVAQAIRSVRWLASGLALWDELRHRLHHRDATILLKGVEDELLELLEGWSQAPPLVNWSMWVVQPGLSDSLLDEAEKVTSLLTAAHAWVASQNVRFSVISSP